MCFSDHEGAYDYIHVLVMCFSDYEGAYDYMC